MFLPSLDADINGTHRHRAQTVADLSGSIKEPKQLTELELCRIGKFNAINILSRMQPAAQYLAYLIAGI